MDYFCPTASLIFHDLSCYALPSSKGSGLAIPKTVTLTTYSSCYSYSVYRRIIDYYNGGSDAYDMRKPLKRDKNRKTVRANGENIRVDPSEVW